MACLLSLPFFDICQLVFSACLGLQDISACFYGSPFPVTMHCPHFLLGRHFSSTPKKTEKSGVDE
ncbi:CLUMA_CG004586, isoform A [Clunio marinus]|uniref:CLUMA_CG004586, isoform A n=1 Tax=Clunio marinus TaxID=568069 RepID=A0A1J1HXM9_9DIPT|nr:CLUMA_CG004586, isoform A [Clunio marinus]